MEWLRYVRHCKLVVMERGMIYRSRPDLFGITPQRYGIEIEIKRTTSDFKANERKSVLCPDGNLAPWIRQFYFLVPPKLVPDVSAMVPSYSGLITLSDLRNGFTHINLATVVKRAPCNLEAERISVQDMIHMVQHQTSTMSRLLSRLANYERNKT